MNKCYCYLNRYSNSNRIIMSLERSSGDSTSRSRIIKRIMSDTKKISIDSTTKVDNTINNNRLNVTPSDRIYKRQPKEENNEVHIVLLTKLLSLSLLLLLFRVQTK